MPHDGHVSPVPREQIETAFDQVLLVLEEAGLDASAIVEVTSYHIGLRSHLDDFKAVWAKRMRPHYPAWTAIEMAGFASEDVMVELRVIAGR